MSEDPTPDVERIAQAARTIAPAFLHTPVVRSEALDQLFGCALALKVETLTPIRSFKGRGSDWLLERLGPLAQAGLVCASAGNFGQGIAYAARTRGGRATVFAAEGANPLKLAAMRRFGAEVRLAGHDFDAAKAAARTHAAATGEIFVEDGLHPAIAEGAGTIALEMDAAGALGDMILVPLGNGSLINGIGRWVKARQPGVRVIGVTAAGAPAMARSWREGRVVATEAARTIADGIAVRVPVPEALTVMRGTVDAIVEVAEDDLLRAMRLVLAELGLLVEPAGAAGLAALLAEPALARGRRVSTILCGGNVTAAQMRAWSLAGTEEHG